MPDKFDLEINDLLKDMDDAKPNPEPNPDKKKEELPTPHQTIHVNPDDVGIPGVSKPNKDDSYDKLISKVIGNFGTLQDQIWAKLNEDRVLIDEYIELFSDRISTTDSTKQYYVEALTNLLNTKAATSMNATKLLDSLAKMISAMKNMDNSNVVSDSNLTNLLQQDKTETFDPDEP